MGGDTRGDNQTVFWNQAASNGGNVAFQFILFISRNSVHYRISIEIVSADTGIGIASRLVFPERLSGLFDICYIVD